MLYMECLLVSPQRQSERQQLLQQSQRQSEEREQAEHLRICVERTRLDSESSTTARTRRITSSTSKVLRSAAQASRAHIVPSLLEREGNFSQTRDRNGNPFEIYDPLTTRPAGGNTFVRDYFPGNIIPLPA